MPVDDRHLLRVRLNDDILVVVFDLLQLGGRLPVGEHDPVAAENAVVRPVVPVSAVQQRFLSEPVPARHRLVDEVPDESALVQFVLIRQLRVFVHGAVGIAHRVGVFAQDERLLPVLFQPFPDPVRRGVHLGFDICDFGNAQFALPEEGHLPVPFVVHRPAGIQPFHFPAHGQNHGPGQALVAAAPDQDARVVPVPPDHGTYPVGQQRLPVLPVPGEHLVRADPSVPQHVPHAVAFHIVLVNHVQPQLVAQAVDRARVRIVAGPDRVDVVPLHQDQIAPDFFLRHRAPGLAAEIVPVRSLEYDADAVHPDHAVFNLDLPESGFHRNDFLRPVRRRQPHFRGVEVRILRAPQPRRADFDAPADLRIPADRAFRLRQRFPAVQQTECHRRSLRRADLRLPLQHAFFQRVVRLRLNLQVPDVRFRRRVQDHIPVQPGEPQKILVLEPASGAETVYPAGKLVLPLPDRPGQFKLVRREAVRGKADVLPVQPYRHAAFRPLEGHENPPTLHRLRQEKTFHVARDGIEPFRNLSRPDRLLPVPRILCVAVLRYAVSLPLDVRGHRHVRPSAAVVFRLLESGNDLPRVHRVEELPLSVQAHAHAGGACLLLRVGNIPFVVRVRIQPVLPEIAGVFQFLLVKHAFAVPLIFCCCFC